MTNNKRNYNPSKHKYFAFISYRGADVELAKKLQKKFNNYKLPSTYTNPFDENNQRMQPVCRDRDNFVGGDVSKQIHDAIDQSMYVVMICTPNMTQNDDQTNYVNDEVQHLIDTGRIDRLIPLVFDGKAYAPDDYKKANRPVETPFQDECLPFVLRKWMAEHNEHDFTLNIFNIEEQGERDEEKMFLRCVATILAEEFNKLWDRFTKEQKKRKSIIAISAAATTGLFIAAILATIAMTRPVDVKVKLNEVSIHNDNLPKLSNAIVTISKDDYVNSDTIVCIDQFGILGKVPHSYLGEMVHLKVDCNGWIPLDTIVNLTKELYINLARDPHPYGDIQFLIWDPVQEKAHAGVKASIEGIEGISDSSGRVFLTIPLVKQDTIYTVSCEIPLTDSILKGFPTTPSTALVIRQQP